MTPITFLPVSLTAWIVGAVIVMFLEAEHPLLSVTTTCVYPSWYSCYCRGVLYWCGIPLIRIPRRPPLAVILALLGADDIGLIDNGAEGCDIITVCLVVHPLASLILMI
jgi:hypothetical protein